MELTSNIHNRFRNSLFLLFYLIVLMNTSYALNRSYGTRNEKTQGNPSQVSDYQYVIIPAKSSTWGYDIYKGKKMLIHQQNIPGLPGNEGFRSKTDAEKVARLVIEKLEKGQMPPSLTKEELQNLKVL